MSKQGGIKELAIGRSDIYRMDPRDLHVKEGWNCRDLDTEDALEALKTLARSIAEVGVKQPLTVYSEDGRTYLSDGHRRLRATMMAIEAGAEVKSVPVQTEDRYSNEAERVFSMIVRNSGRPLLPIEQARVFKRLVDLGWNERDIATKSGLNRAWVVELLELQAAPEAVTSLVKSGKVAATLAINTLKANKGDKQKTADDLTEAVKTAKAQGKKRATAKHLADRKPTLKAELKALFEAATVDHVKHSEPEQYQVTFSADEYAKLRVLLGV